MLLEQPFGTALSLWYYLIKKSKDKKNNIKKNKTKQKANYIPIYLITNEHTNQV
ncbi:MAG: hypothetical protein MJA29_04230 [Candidatus Omnitrophica bacterium]|nr:hypothetical protein [Candidatus Omnitrophota bacterium]